MTQAGWYPDPENPGRARYWDGQKWAPAGQDPGEPPKDSKTGIWVGLVALTTIIMLVVVLLLTGRLPGVGGEVAPDTQSARPTGSVWDETLPTETPTETASPGEGGETVECPRVENVRTSANEGNLIVGGGLAFEMPSQGWRLANFTWSSTLTDQVSVDRNVPGTTWYSVITVGTAPAANGFIDPRITAHQVMDCYLTSAVYPGLTDTEVLEDEAIAVDGRDGWWIRSEALSTEAPGGGATFDYIVLDIGDPEGLAVFFAEATFADDQVLIDTTAARDSLRVR